MMINLTQPRAWMGNNPAIGRLRIDELILPGSHGSGFDKQARHGGSTSEVSQDVPPAGQIAGGIRVLELRTQFLPTFGQQESRRFSLFNLNTSGRTVIDDVIDPLIDFLDSSDKSVNVTREIIILDLQAFKGFSSVAHQHLQRLLTLYLRGRVIPYALRNLTLNQLWSGHPGKNVVLAYNHPSASDPFWPGVSQKWSGGNTNSLPSLKLFMDQSTQQKKPEHVLSSIQCTRYSLPHFAPDDFSEQIDSWFDSQDRSSYIQNFYIINTDWSLRSAIVRNCVHGNLIRAAARKR